MKKLLQAVTYLNESADTNKKPVNEESTSLEESLSKEFKQFVKEGMMDEAVKKPMMFRIDVLQGLRGIATNAVKKLGLEIDSQGYTDGSTGWAISVYNRKFRTADELDNALRKVMGSSDDEGGGYRPGENYTGYLRVSDYSNLEEELVAEHGDKWERDQEGRETGWGFKDTDGKPHHQPDDSASADANAALAAKWAKLSPRARAKAEARHAEMRKAIGLDDVSESASTMASVVRAKKKENAEAKKQETCSHAHGIMTTKSDGTKQRDCRDCGKKNVPLEEDQINEYGTVGTTSASTTAQAKAANLAALKNQSAAAGAPTNTANPHIGANIGAPATSAQPGVSAGSTPMAGTVAPQAAAIVPGQAPGTVAPVDPGAQTVDLLKRASKDPSTQAQMRKLLDKVPLK